MEKKSTGAVFAIMIYKIRDGPNANRYLSLFCVHHRDAERFKQLIAVPLQRLPEALKRVQRTFRKHAAEIIASFKCQLSNGPVEGINNKIKVIKRVAYGYRNFDHFRGRILLSCRNEYIDFDHLNTQKIA